MYPPEHSHTSRAEMYRELIKITAEPKITLIGETGTLPSVDAIIEENIGWAGYMAWSGGFVTSEQYTDKETLRIIYNSPYAITLDKLPKLY